MRSTPQSPHWSDLREPRASLLTPGPRVPAARKYVDPRYFENFGFLVPSFFSTNSLALGMESDRLYLRSNYTFLDQPVHGERDLVQEGKSVSTLRNSNGLKAQSGGLCLYLSVKETYKIMVQNHDKISSISESGGKLCDSPLLVALFVKENRLGPFLGLP